MSVGVTALSTLRSAGMAAAGCHTCTTGIHELEPAVPLLPERQALRAAALHVLKHPANNSLRAPNAPCPGLFIKGGHSS